MVTAITERFFQPTELKARLQLKTEMPPASAREVGGSRAITEEGDGTTPRFAVTR